MPPRWAGGIFAAIAVCAWIDAAIPQPGPGSRWITPRRVVAWIGGNWAHATNAIQPGSVAASITPASVLAAVCSTHAAASEERQAIAGKLGDVQQRVTQVLVRTAMDRQP